jgi:hypothetical protein
LLNTIRLCLIALVAVAFVSAGANSFAQAPELRGGAMLDCSGLPCVDATLANGKHLKLLVDTGDYNSTLDREVAKQLGLDVAPVSGQDGKPVPGYGKSVLSGLKIGDGSLGDIKILVMDLAQEVKRNHMPACDGSITYTAFKNRLLQLDYVKRLVRFSEPLTHEVACRGSCGEITLPTFGKKGPPIVVATGFSVNQKPITAQIDTLFSGTMLIYPTSVDKLGLNAEVTSQKKRFFPYTDDGVNMFEATAKTEGFGQRSLASNTPLYFAAPEVHLPDGMFDGTVGQELFAHSILNLDFHNMKFWIE